MAVKNSQPSETAGADAITHKGGCELTRKKYMKNEELSKLISELERGLEKLKQLINAEASLAKPEPSIFERFPVGSYICGMNVVKHDKGSDLTFAIGLGNGRKAWIETEIIETLAACQDWIEKYHPFLEEYRKEWEYHTDDPVVPINIKAQKIGLWANKTPIKKPWEDA